MPTAVLSYRESLCSCTLAVGLSINLYVAITQGNDAYISYYASTVFAMHKFISLFLVEVEHNVHYRALQSPCLYHPDKQL